jgi:hypothetical protein
MKINNNNNIFNTFSIIWQKKLHILSYKKLLFSQVITY